MALTRRGPRLEAFIGALTCVLLVSGQSLVVASSALAPEASGQQGAPSLAAELGVSTKRGADNSPPATSHSESQVTATSQEAADAPSAKDKSNESTKINNDDINSLLASKNDADNDLAGTNNKPEAAGLDELDSPVDTAVQAGGKPAEADKRFHYNVGSESDSAEAASKNPAETTTVALEDKENNSTASQREPQEVFDLQEEANKKEAASKSTPALEAPASSTTTAAAPSPATSSESKPGLGEAEVDVKSDEKMTKSVVVEAAKKDPGAERPAELESVHVKEVEATSLASPAVSVQTTTEAAKAEPPQTSSSEPSRTDDKVVPTTLQTTTAEPTPASTTGKPVQESVNKAVDVPSVIASAVGSAIGSAVGSAIKPILAGRDKPSTPAADSSTSSTTSSTQRPSTSPKSSSDKWNRWSPSTPSLIGGSGAASSSPPPTRRRPILPSIRRRFRPYNRLNPFPWGVDSYSSDFDRDFAPAEQQPPSRPSLSSTLRPRRRFSTSPEPPRSSTSRHNSSSGHDDDDDDDGDLRPSSTRRGESGPGHHRRRHHHHQHHHDHHRHNHDRDGEFSGPRRRYNHNHNNHHRHFNREDPLHGVADAEPSFGRPNMPGFSLFNTGSTSGSGFDLLNPFSGWLDLGSSVASRPSPGHAGSNSAATPQIPSSHVGSAGRLPGRKPIPVEGDYNDSPLPHSGRGRDTHIHVHGGSGGRPPIITGVGGDGDYENGHHGHHGHDCHDHDYDHDHHDHHRERDPPYRPGGHHGRDPYRPGYGGEDSYSGSRPGRPYNRRDESEISPGSSQKDKRERERERERDHDSDDHRQDSSGPSLLHSSPSSSTLGGPKRLPSLFSPFESLFGALDDELRSVSTFIEGAPIRSTPIIRPPQTFVDTVVSSPKISMPAEASAAPAATIPSGDKLNESKKPAAAPDAESDEGKTTGIRVSGLFARGLTDDINPQPFSQGNHPFWPDLQSTSLKNNILEFLSRL